MSEPGARTADQRKLVFRLGAQTYALDGHRVREVIRMPALTRVPHGPAALAGIANLRGVALPVVSAAALLGLSSVGDGKVIVYDCDGRVGLMVDDVMSLATGDAGQALIFNADALLAAVFATAPDGRSRSGVRPPQAAVADTATRETLRRLLSFHLAGQRFGLPLEDVREILAWPAEIELDSDASGETLGLISRRGRVLPIVSVAALLGLVRVAPDPLTARVLVIAHGGGEIGLAIDRIDAIRRLGHRDIDAVPLVLRRGRGPAEIVAVGRIEHGKGLVLILSTERIFDNGVVGQALEDQRETGAMLDVGKTAVASEKFLLFMLGGERYAVPVAAVDEVVRIPDTITRVPNAPAFVKGVMNLRGQALPLIDQRQRFDAPVAAGTRPRAIVMTIGTLTAGFVVDGAAEIVAFPAGAVSDAFGFASDGAEVFDRVAHIEADGRMILIVNPQELLSRAERDIVASVAHESASS